MPEPGGIAPRMLEPGVSHALARWRAARYADVRYALELDLAADRDSVVGALELRLRLRRPCDIVLDWRTVAGHRIGAVTVNGARASGLRRVRDHVVIPRALARTGENVVALRLRTIPAPSGAALTRHRDPADDREYVYSLFVPSDASTVFPCFDQPDLKARFALTLAVPAGWRAVSNAPVAGVGDGRIRFEDTPPLSTYTFAFAAGPFAVIEEPGRGRPPARLFVRASQRARARRQAEEAFRLHRGCVRFLERYLAQPFPFAKHDLVLLAGFPYGGMEHAGATFLREDQLLLSAVPTAAERMRRAQLLCHETAHQWIGNLVTMRWFDDLWIKEGFANFLAAKAVPAVLPDSGVELAFERLKAAAAATDATRGATPMHRPLGNLADAKAAYGNIVYGKAPAVLRQAERYFGATRFREAVRGFVSRHAFGAVDRDDFARSLSRAVGRPVAEWVRAWIERAGRPEVQAAWQVDRRGRIERLALRQAGGAWPMAIDLVLGGERGRAQRVPVRLDGRSAAVAAAIGRPAPRYLFANGGGWGYGRFPLDPRSRAGAIAALPAVADPALRAALLDALWQDVRDARLAPCAFIDVVLERVRAGEREPVVAALLDQLETVFRRWLAPTQAAAIADRIEGTLQDAALRRAPAAVRLAYLRAYVATASSSAARRRLASLARGRLQGMPIDAAERARAATRLLVLGASGAPALLASALRASSPDDAARRRFVAGAGRPTPAVKARYFRAFLHDERLPEHWIEEALVPFNAPEHATLTQPYLAAALAALPRLQRRRKIFFVQRWLAAFLGGQTGAGALAIAHRAARRERLGVDLRLALLEQLDALGRTVRIRDRHGAC